MILPDYKNGSVVNLASSILRAFGAGFSYKPLVELKDLREAKNVILLVVDGLGYEYTMANGDNSILRRNVVRKLTSVFPATTASALIALETGVAPQQHGITGWFMHLKELGAVSAILPFVPRCQGDPFTQSGVERSQIFTEKRINEKIKSPSFIIYPKKIVDGKVNKKEKNVLTHDSLDEMFLKMKKIIKKNKSRKYIYAYWPEFDSLSHFRGAKSKFVRDHFYELDWKISTFLESIKGTNTTLIVTADHGLIDTSIFKRIFLADHPRLEETLALPLCGEPRAAYCYVRASRKKQFEDYVKAKLSYCCTMHKSEELIKKGYFGLFEPNRKLFDRVGDYVLIMKDNYIIKDRLLNETARVFIGNHGGMSPEEMFVPLILFKNI